MKTLLLAIVALTALSIPARSVEPDYAFPHVGTIRQVEQSTGRIVIAWETEQFRPVRGSIIYVRWGSGDFFARVMKVRGTTLTLDYLPTSTSIDIGANVSLVYR
jgi:hypothetical protein